MHLEGVTFLQQLSSVLLFSGSQVKAGQQERITLLPNFRFVSSFPMGSVQTMDVREVRQREQVQVRPRDQLSSSALLGVSWNTIHS